MDKLSHRKPVTAWNSRHVFPLQFSLNLFQRNVEFKLLSKLCTFQKYSSTRDRALVLQYPNLSSNNMFQFLQEMYMAHVSSAFQCTPEIIKTGDSGDYNPSHINHSIKMSCTVVSEKSTVSGQGTVIHEVIHMFRFLLQFSAE